MQSSEQIIQEAIDCGWINSLAFHYYVKARYSNSTIFDFSSRKASRKLNLSPTTINNHIRELEQKKLITTMYKKGKTNITFKKISQKHKCTLNITIQDSLKDIEQKLRFKIFEMAHRQQLHSIRNKDEARQIPFKKFPTNTEIKRLNKFKSSPPESQKIGYKVTFTDKTLAKMQNVSVKTAQTLKKYWQDKKWIIFQSVKSKVEKVGKFLKDAPKFGQFVFMGWLWEVSPTEYILLTTYGNKTLKGKEEGNLIDRVNKYLKKQNSIRKAA